MRRSHATFLRAFSIWTVYVWVTRIWNIWRDHTRDGAFKAVHTVLAVVSVAFAIGCWIVVRRERQAAVAGRSEVLAGRE